MTQSWNESQDEFVVLDNGSQKRKLSSEIFGAGAFLDTAAVSNGATTLVTGDHVYDWVIAQGYTTETGDITGVSAGTGLSGGGNSGAVTVSLSHLGIQDLADPDADRVLGWDESAGVVAWFTLNSNITSSGTNINSTDTNTTYSVGDGGLTQKNFTTTLKTKLDGIASSANNYSHPTSAGNKHIPSGGSSGEFLKYDSSGTAVWATPSYTTNTDTNTWRGVTAGGNTLASNETLAFTAGTNVTITESGGAVTINSTDQYTGTSNLALGSSSSTAYRGDRGTTAYNHSQATHAPTDANNYSHPTGAGNKHIPSGGSSGEFLKYSASGTAVWATPSYTTNTDTNTWRGVTAGGNTLSTSETLAFTAGSNVTITESGGAVTIASTDTNTDTNTWRGVTAGGNTLASNETLAFTAGSNVTISESAGAVTIASTDTNTNTTYSAGSGIGLSTTTFSVAVNASGGSNLTQDSNGISLTATPTFTTVTATGDITSNTGSDMALKENIINIPNPLEKISKIGGYMFDWKDHGYEDVHGKGHDTGIIAQEIEAILPEIVNTRESGMKAVNYTKLIPLLIESIKELTKEVESLKDSKT